MGEERGGWGRRREKEKEGERERERASEQGKTVTSVRHLLLPAGAIQQLGLRLYVVAAARDAIRT